MRLFLVFAIVACSMFGVSGLIAQTTNAPVTSSPAATVSNGIGQESNEAAITKPGEKKITPGADTKNQERQNLWSPALVGQLSLGIGCFAIVILVCVTILLKRLNDPIMPEQILRTFGILVIIFAAIFLVIAGYSDTQIAPVIGLLGTIAGYLLGRRTERSQEGRRDHKHQTSDHGSKIEN